MGNDVIIFQHQYPRVDGVQLINHFVSGGVRYYIHIRKKEGARAAWRNKSDTPTAFIRGAHSRIADHGSLRIIAMPTNGPTLTHNDFRPNSGVTVLYLSLSFSLTL